MMWFFILVVLVGLKLFFTRKADKEWLHRSNFKGLWSRWDVPSFISTILLLVHVLFGGGIFLSSQYSAAQLTSLHKEWLTRPALYRLVVRDVHDNNRVESSELKPLDKLKRELLQKWIEDRKSEVQWYNDTLAELHSRQHHWFLRWYTTTKSLDRLDLIILGA